MDKTVLSIVIGSLIIGGSIFLTAKNEIGTSGDTKEPIVNNVNNVQIVDGKQVIDLRARGGYQPRRSNAKAGMPTVLKVNTSGTFDCSASIRIPSLGIAKYLPSTGVTEFDLGTPQVGIMQGSCGMGMYPFEIDFQN